MQGLAPVSPNGISISFFWTAFAVLVIILVSPLSVDTVPPLLDYPIHLARSYIAGSIDHEPILDEIFDISWRPIPNLAGDVLLSLLLNFFELEDAGRVLLAFCLTATVAGVFVLHRVIFGYWSYLSFLAFLPAWHGAFVAGFVNYSIGLAALLFVLAGSYWVRDKNVLLSVVFDTVAALLLLFCHVVVVGIFGIFLFSRECIRLIAWDQGRYLVIFKGEFVARVLIPFILPAVVYIQYTFIEVVSREKFQTLGEWKIYDKLRALLMPILSGNIIIDIMSCIILIVSLLIILSRGRFTLRPDFFLGIILVIFVALTIPGQILDAAFISDRLPVAAVLIGLASYGTQQIGKRFVAVLLCSLFVVVALRASYQRADWLESHGYYLRLAQSLEVIEQGSSVLIASPLTNVGGRGVRFWAGLRSDRPRWQFALLNLPTLHALPSVLLTQQAAFSQLHFVWSDKQILSLSDAFSALDYGDGGTSTWAPESIFTRTSGGCIEFSAIVDPFDYVLIVYADLLETTLREDIDAFAPVYADDEILLLRTSSLQSWRAQRLAAFDRDAFDRSDGQGPSGNLKPKAGKRCSIHVTQH